MAITMIGKSKVAVLNRISDFVEATAKEDNDCIIDLRQIHTGEWQGTVFIYYH